VSIHVVRVMVDALVRAGVPSARLLEAVDLDAAQLAAADARLPYQRALAIGEAALSSSGDPAFGLHWAEHMSVDAFSPITYLTLHAANLGEGLESLTRFSRLLSDDPHLDVQYDAAEVRMCCKRHDVLSEGMQRMIAELATVGFLRIVRCFSPAFRPERVCFAYPAPAYRSEYTRIFEGAERFEQEFTGIAFERGLLAACAGSSDETVHAAMRALAERRIGALDQQQPYAARTRELLVLRGRIGGPAMVDVATQLGLSVHALRRRLAAEGVSFNALESDAFAVLARRLLLDQQRSIQEAAYELGFSGTATFHRAFKRAMGMTPGAYLESQLGAVDGSQVSRS
jgi:AraC-like DNA-binding protein